MTMRELDTDIAFGLTLVSPTYPPEASSRVNLNWFESPGDQSVRVASDPGQVYVIARTLPTPAVPGTQLTRGIQDQDFARQPIRDRDAVAEEDRSNAPIQREGLVQTHHHAWFRREPKRLVTGPRCEQVRGRRPIRGLRAR